MEENKKTTKAETTFLDLVGLLWKNRLLIIIGTFLTMVFTYAIVRFFVQETYRASAALVHIYAGGKTSVVPPNLSIDSLQELLKSPDLINEVVNKLKWREKYPKLNIESLIKQLDIDTVVEEDTSVSRRVAPLILISGIGWTKKEAMDFTNTWADTFIERYSRLMAYRIDSDFKEIEKQNEVLKDKNDRLKEEIKTLGGQRVRLINEIKYYDSLFTGKNQGLIDRTSELDQIKSETESVLASLNQYKKSLEEEITFKTNKEKGEEIKNAVLGEVVDKDNLIYLSLKQQIFDSEAYYKSLLSRRAELEKIIENLHKEIGEIINILSDKKLELETAILNYENKFTEYDSLKGSVSSVEIEYTNLKALADKDSLGGYFLYVQSRAIEPDRRESPKRALVTLIAGFLAFLILSGISFFIEYIPKIDYKH